MNLCSHQVSNCPVYPRARREWGCWPTMAPPRDEQDPQRLRSVLFFDNLHLENSFEDNVVSGQHVLDMLLLSLSTVGLTALQRSNRGKCAHLLRDLDATADLPPHCPLFALQLLDLTQRWWSESEDPDVEEVDVDPLAAAAYISIKLHSARYPDPAPFQHPDPRQPARFLTDLFLSRRQRRIEPPLHTAHAVLEVVVEEYRVLDSVNCELATCSPAGWVGSASHRGLTHYSHCWRHSFRGSRKHGLVSSQ